MTAECSGSRQALSSVRWYVVPGVSTVRYEGREVNAHWTRDGNRVVLAEFAALSGALVRHEMLHAQERSGAHHRAAFLERCGGVVACTATCLQEAGASPVPRHSVPRIAPSRMEVAIAVTPGQPGPLLYDGHFSITVTARNPRRDSVVVLLPPSGDGAPPRSFSFEISGTRAGLWHAERAWDAGVAQFGPGATHRAVFDFIVGPASAGSHRLPAGRYTVRAGFGDGYTAEVPLLVAP